MTVDLLVLTTINGRRMIEPESGTPLSRSILRFRSTRFLNAICYTDNTHIMATNDSTGCQMVNQTHILTQLKIIQFAMYLSASKPC